MNPAELPSDAGSDLPQRVDMAGIQIDHAEHRSIWKQWSEGVETWTAREGRPGRRYHPDNRMFGDGSARLLAGALHAIRPRRYVEIGSGFSSAVALDVNDEQRPDDPMQCTFVEPNADRLRSLLREEDHSRCELHEYPVQSVPLSVFEEIQAGDVLLIDSTHVAKSGSDLLRELFEILPSLPRGAFVHFHDIQYPFEYPRSWLVAQNRSWNEAYFLRAFLMYNSKFEVYFWTDYWGLFGREEARADGTEHLLPSRSSSLWLRCVGPR